MRRTTHGPIRCGWPGGCVSEAHDGHELVRRSAGGSIDPASGNVVPLCRGHHDWVGAHPTAAEAMGLDVRPPTVAQRVTVWDTFGVSESPRLAVRIPQPAADQITAIMAATGATRTVVVRAMLRVAIDERDRVVERVRAYTKASDRL